MNRFFTPGKISENMRKTPEGYLLCLDVPIARTGAMEYAAGETPLEHGPNGRVMVDRDPEEVFRAATIASFEGKPITIQHPENFVTPENWKLLAKGTIQNVRRGVEKDENGEESLIADLLITDGHAIELVTSGLREVSCGYEAEYEQVGKGKGKQTRIVGNHLALVEEGRAGSTYAINDQKGKSMFEKMIEQIKALGKTADALSKDKKTKDGQSPPQASQTKEGDTEMKSFDENGGQTTSGKKDGDTEMKTFDKEAYDAFQKAFQDFAGKMEGFLKGKSDEGGAQEPESDEDAPQMGGETDGGDEPGAEGGGENEIMKRVMMLEKAVAKMLGAGAQDSESAEGESAAMEDDDLAEEEEMADAALEGTEGENSQKKYTGDVAAFVEILSPGMNAKQKDIERKALKAAFSTRDGRDAILSVTGGKAPDFDKDNVLPLFRATAQILKFKRGTGLERTRDGNAFQTALKFGEFSAAQAGEKMTPEQLNKMNAEFWASKRK